MIVDEENEVIQKAKLFLKDNNIEIISVASSKEAITVLDDNKEPQVDLILVSTLLPGTTKNGLFSVKPTASLYDAETKAFLQKPFTKEELVEFVKDRINR